MSPVVRTVQRLWHHLITNRALAIYTAINVTVVLALILGDLLLW